MFNSFAYNTVKYNSVVYIPVAEEQHGGNFSKKRRRVIQRPFAQEWAVEGTVSFVWVEEYAVIGIVIYKTVIFLSALGTIFKGWGLETNIQGAVYNDIELGFEAKGDTGRFLIEALSVKGTILFNEVWNFDLNGTKLEKIREFYDCKGFSAFEQSNKLDVVGSKDISKILMTLLTLDVEQ